MQVTIEFADDIIKTTSIENAWDLFYLYQKGAQLAGEMIDTKRKANWDLVELSLRTAEDGDTIDFRLLGDIYFEEGITDDNID